MLDNKKGRLPHKNKAMTERISTRDMKPNPRGVKQSEEPEEEVPKDREAQAYAIERYVRVYYSQYDWKLCANKLHL